MGISYVVKQVNDWLLKIAKKRKIERHTDKQTVRQRERNKERKKERMEGTKEERNAN
jgi:hypothetical protein